MWKLVDEWLPHTKCDEKGSLRAFSTYAEFINGKLKMG
jgi:hypothetical protein